MLNSRFETRNSMHGPDFIVVSQNTSMSGPKSRSTNITILRQGYTYTPTYFFNNIIIYVINSINPFPHIAIMQQMTFR